MSQIIEVVKVNDLRSGTKNDKKWEMQDAACLLYGTDGLPSAVGTIMLPKHLRGDCAPKRGRYEATYELAVGMMDGRINAVIKDLRPVVGSVTPDPIPTAKKAA